MRVSLRSSQNVCFWLIVGAACLPPRASSQSGKDTVPSSAAQSAGNQVGTAGGSRRYSPNFFVKMNAKTALDMVKPVARLHFLVGRYLRPWLLCFRRQRPN